MGDILLVLLVLGLFLVIYSAINYDRKHKKDEDGLDYYNSIEIQCPVCKNKKRFSKDQACTRAVTLEIEQLKKLSVSCKSCKADLSGLYFSHPFVREALTEAEHLQGSKELTMQFLEELAKLKEVTNALGESYAGEVSTMQPNSKQRV